MLSNLDHGVLTPGVPIKKLISEVQKGVAVEVTFIDPSGDRWRRIGPNVQPI